MINYVYPKQTEGEAPWEEKVIMKMEYINSLWKSWGLNTVEIESTQKL